MASNNMQCHFCLGDFSRKQTVQLRPIFFLAGVKLIYKSIITEAHYAINSIRVQSGVSTFSRFCLDVKTAQVTFYSSEGLSYKATGLGD